MHPRAGRGRAAFRCCDACLVTMRARAVRASEREDSDTRPVGHVSTQRAPARSNTALISTLSALASSTHAQPARFLSRQLRIYSLLISLLPSVPRTAAVPI